MSTPQSTSSPATTASSSAKRVATSTSGNGSGSSSSHNNPFRSGSRDNLPSFAECFSGFHKTAHLGEHNIVAASPQQQWGASGSRAASSSASAHTHTSTSGMLLPVSATLSPLQLTPRRERTPSGVPSSNQRHGTVLGQAPAQPQPGHHGQEAHPTDFSYRTLDLSDEDETASDPLGTPPRQIEREDNSDEGAVFQSGGSRVGGDSGHATPVQRPPLHPAISPILSSPGRGEQPPPLTTEAAHSPHTEMRFGTEGSSRRGYDGSPQRNTVHTASVPRRARSLEELAVKHLYPLFGEFLRSLPPKRLEAFVMQADENGVDDGSGGLDDGSWRGGWPSHGAKKSGAHQSLQDAYALPYVAGRSAYGKYAAPVGSVMERVDMIIPPYHSIIDAPGNNTSTLYTRRDFAYHHPVYEDYAGPMTRRYDEGPNWRSAARYRR